MSFYTLEECEKALQAMNGGECDGRLIRVEKAKRNSGYSKTPGVCKCIPTTTTIATTIATIIKLS